MSVSSSRILDTDMKMSYQPLLDSNEEYEAKNHDEAMYADDDNLLENIYTDGHKRAWFKEPTKLCVIILFMLLGFTFGVCLSVMVLASVNDLSAVAGKFLYDMPPMSPPGNVHVMFEHNDTFPADTVESHDMWRAIIPNGMGMIQHPAFGPEIVGVSFVHQLHCVNRLRQGYYSALNGTENAQTTHHIRHCLEYLRQTIMCHVDTNLEYREEHPVTKEVSTSGYTDHQCRDFGEMFDFVEKWRVMNGKARGEEDPIPVEEDTIPGRTIHWDYVSSRGDDLPI